MKLHLDQLESRCLPAAFALAPAAPFVFSTANVLTYAVRAYEMELGRLPSEAELARYVPFAQWAAATHDATAAQAVWAGIAASEEFRAGMSDKDVLDKAFVYLLGRPPGATESVAWGQRMQAVGSAAVAYELATSPEANQQHARADYGQFFFRQPSAAELDFWPATPWLEQDRIDLDSGEFASLNPIDEPGDAAYPITVRYGPGEFQPLYRALYPPIVYAEAYL